MASSKEAEQPDHFRAQIRRIASLLSWGQDVSEYDPLMVAAAHLYLKWNGNN